MTSIFPARRTLVLATSLTLALAAALAAQRTESGGNVDASGAVPMRIGRGREKPDSDSASLDSDSDSFGRIPRPPAPSASRLSLNAGWRIQSSAKVRAAGGVISRAGSPVAGWRAATLPATVLAALVADGVYPDPYHGMNLRRIPGTTYPVGYNFSHIEMPDSSPFAVPWWYRKTFRVPASMAGKHLALHFDGINYRANIWLNGRRIADSTEVAGAYRRYDLDITDAVRPGVVNVLAVEVFPPTPHDLAITWVDWNPAPPDKDMGLWHGVYLTASGPVQIRYPYVITKVAPSLDTAELTVVAELRNLSGSAVKGVLRGTIAAPAREGSGRDGGGEEPGGSGGSPVRPAAGRAPRAGGAERAGNGARGSVAFEKPVELGPHDSVTVRLTPAEVPALRMADPRLWWPAAMGKPELYSLDLRFEAGTGTSDAATLPFGIRQITAERTADSTRLFLVNGKRLLIRGGGWAPDMMLRAQPDKQLAELRYVLDLGLNTIRLEGKLEDDRFWARADSMGILVMAGWCCCSGWEEWDKWTDAERADAAASQKSQILRLRAHASALMWLNGSDGHPPPDVEKMYIDILNRYDWQNPYLSSASGKPSEVTGKNGVKMSGPYDWVPPRYWSVDTAHGGAFGFNTETSPGAAPPPLASMRRMLPPAHLSPDDSVWRFHAAGGQFRHSDRFDRALAERYGKPTSALDYTRRAQALAYEGERAMFDAYTRAMYRSTGIIQWMLNDAWPSTWWHLYDYYLRPGGAYFGAKKALEPVHAIYAYDDRGVVLVNTTHEARPGLTVSARIVNLDGAEPFHRDTTVDLPPDTALRLFTLPTPGDVSPAYFVSLRVTRAETAPARGVRAERPGAAAAAAASAPGLAAANVYWLSTHHDVLDEDSATWYVTPVRQYADLTSLAAMPSGRVTATVAYTRDGPWRQATVHLVNAGRAPAFFIRLMLTRGAGGEEVLPVLWSDNYVTLMPGEPRTLTARVRAADLRGAAPAVAVEGWNVAPAAVHR